MHTFFYRLVSWVGKIVIACMIVGVPIGLWLLWGLFGAPLFAARYPHQLQELGQVGDIFGGVNALFAAFAFAGVAVAAFFQYRTNVLQKQGLTITSFEPLFFHLLELHQETYSRLDLDFTPFRKIAMFQYHAYGGAAAASALRTTIRMGHFKPLGHRARGEGFQREDFSPLLQLFDDFYISNEDQLGPYYRTFYHVFNLIDLSELPSAIKVRYANIARATINKDELLLLMLNCSCPRGESFKRLVENYGLLKHISTDEDKNYLDVAMATTLFHSNATKASADRI